MADDQPVTDSQLEDPLTPEAGVRKKGPIWNSFFLLRNRVLAGFIVALPVIITFIIIKWLYEFLAKDVIGYTAKLLIDLWASQPGESSSAKTDLGNTNLDAAVDGIRNLPADPWFISNILAPITAITLIISLLFVLGMVFRSRWHRFFDWAMSSVPGIGVIYRSVNNVIASLRQGTNHTKKFQRVVLVKFPHPGIKVPAFVTSSCLDSSTGKEILCIYVPTTPIPTSGYMLLVPAEEVTEISWDLQTTLQAIVSGGITVPDRVEYTIGVVNSEMPINAEMMAMPNGNNLGQSSGATTNPPDEPTPPTGPDLGTS